MKKAILILSLSILVFAATEPANPLFMDDTAAPITVNGGIESGSGKDLIAEDNLQKKDIAVGEVVSNNLGKSRIDIFKDESGNIVIYNKDGSLFDINDVDPDDLDNYNEIADIYKDSVNAIQKDDDNVSVADLMRQNNESYQLKKQQITNANNMFGSVEESKDFFLSKRSPLSSANSLQGSFTSDSKELRKKMEEGEVLTEAEMNELNATEFYRENLSQNPAYDRQKNIKDGNAGLLSEAYKDLSDLQDITTARMKSGRIKCQISRNLVPLFFCPISGKDGLRFPADSNDVLKVDMNDMLDRCNAHCTSSVGDYPVVSERAITDANIASMDIKFAPKELYPNLSDSNKLITINATGTMPLEYIKIKITAPVPEGFTEEEWHKKLDKYHPRVRFSLNYKNKTRAEDGSIIESTAMLYRDAVLDIYSTEQVYSFPVEQIGVRYDFTIMKPYFSKRGDDISFKNNGGKIFLAELKSKYVSDSFHYCSFKQTVTSVSDCFDPDKNLKVINSNGQNVLLCKDQKHKMGPVPTWGGFYTLDQAEAACVIRTPCEPTYSLSDGVDTSVVYKTEIGCVDDPTNLACSDQLCEEFFRDQNRTILNEYYVNVNGENKIDNRYSIQNAAPTEIPRPKIDFESLDGTTNSTIEEIFQSEEKDAAYLTMIEEATFNRNRYRLGEESPATTFYEVLGTRSDPTLVAKLKPNSFDYGSDTDFYVYSVLIMDHFFEPIAGSWYINGTEVTITDSNLPSYSNLDPYAGDNDTYNETEGEEIVQPSLRFMDRTYAVKTGEGNGDWLPFRVIKNYKYENTSTEVYVDDQGAVKERTRVEWVDIPAYTEDTIMKYSITAGKFLPYDMTSERAPYFETTNFPVGNDFFNFTIANSMTSTYVSIPGGLIRDQLSINRGTQFERLYNVSFSKLRHDSYIRNATFFLLYADHKMTYAEILAEIEGDEWQSNPKKAYNVPWGVFEVINKSKFSSRPHGDEEISNGIRLIKKGKPNKLTLGVNWTPNEKDKGQKAYKYMFLYGDEELN